MLDVAIRNLEIRYGKGSVMRLGDTNNLDIEPIPTGIDSLDIALGIGGIPKGRIIEIFGGESSGKTTLSLLIAAQVQQSGGTAVFIDMEHALDPAYAESLGVDIDSLLVSQPDTGEQAFEICNILMQSKAVDLIIFDSVAAMVTQAELDNNYDYGNQGLPSKLMSKGLKRITSALSVHKTTIIFTNQLREKIGVIYGNPEITCGGRALKFYSSVRLETRRQEQVKRGIWIIGQRILAKVVKNKVAPPYKEANFDLMFYEAV